MNTSLLPSKNGYGTFPESSATIECGRKCYINPLSGFIIPFLTTLVVKNDGSTARDNCCK